MMASGRNGTLYVGVTADLSRRVFEHREGVQDGFVMDDPKISGGDVSVVVIDFDCSEVRFIGLG